MRTLTKTRDGLLSVDQYSLINKALLLLVGTGILTLSSYIEVPMVPVPMTMQTYAVLMLACLYGLRMGTINVLVWLGLAALGAPLLAGATGGLIKFVGPTAGYLLGFIIATAFVGYFSDRGINGKRPLLAFIMMFIGTKIILGLGYLWLGLQIGWQEAWITGVAPFLFGDFVKVALAVATVTGFQSLTQNKP